MAHRLVTLTLGFFLLATLRLPATDSTYVRFNTSLGYIDVLLYSDTGEAPLTVANFLTYVNSGAYTNSIFHRIATVSSDGVSVIQGGGFYNYNTSTPNNPF